MSSDGSYRRQCSALDGLFEERWIGLWRVADQGTYGDLGPRRASYIYQNTRHGIADIRQQQRPSSSIPISYRVHRKLARCDATKLFNVR